MTAPRAKADGVADSPCQPDPDQEAFRDYAECKARLSRIIGERDGLQRQVVAETAYLWELQATVDAITKREIERVTGATT